MVTKGVKSIFGVMEFQEKSYDSDWVETG